MQTKTDKRVWKCFEIVTLSSDFPSSVFRLILVKSRSWNRQERGITFAVSLALSSVWNLTLCVIYCWTSCKPGGVFVLKFFLRFLNLHELRLIPPRTTRSWTSALPSTGLCWLQKDPSVVAVPSGLFVKRVRKQKCSQSTKLSSMSHQLPIMFGKQ